jgi:DNA-binding transcriptional MocR family regulator
VDEIGPGQPAPACDDDGTQPVPTLPRPVSTSPPTSAAALARLIVGWEAGHRPLYRSLAAAVHAAVDRGDLPDGTRLPAERAAAGVLGVARGTVVAAYDLLQDDGVVDRRRGSGTWVVAGTGPELRLHELAAGLRARQLTRNTVGWGNDTIDLALSVLQTPADLPADAFRLDPVALDTVAHGHGYHPAGLPALRERLAALHTAHGVPTTPDQIVVTLGAQQAVALSARLLVQPGDVVAVESPTYPGAIDAYSRAGARFAVVDGDSAGVRPDDAARVVAARAARVLYVVPSAHNPRGTVLPEHRRQDLATLSDELDMWVVEDECLAWCVYGSDGPPLPVVACGSGRRVLTIGSLSKVLWGGLRLGWIRGPAPAVARLGRLKAAQDLGNCAVSQAVTLGLFDRIEQIAAERRRALAAGAALAVRLLAEALPDWRVRPPDGGLSLWVGLPRGTGDEFAPVALRHGVRVLAGSAASPDEAHLDRLRLAVSLPPATLRLAVARLAAAWHEFAAGATSQPGVRVSTL